MSEICSACRGEGEVWDDRDGCWRDCMNCGGEGRVDPYLEDEWWDDSEYDDVEMTDEGWANYVAWVEQCNVEVNDVE